jgi:hypothetical protein
MTTGQDDVTLKDLQDVWREAATAEVVADPNTQWLLGGVNLRVDLLKALKAAYLTTTLCLKGKLAIATGNLGPTEMLALGKLLFDACVTTLDALRERLRNSTYVACVVLAGNQDGLTEVELEREIKAFVDGADAAKLPFYMGFTESYLDEARKEIRSPNAFKVVLDDLRKGKWVTESDGRLFFKERHFVWSSPTLV